MSSTILIMAKAPVPGRVKTRLTPALTNEWAAIVAAASLMDTIETALSVPDVSVVVALDASSSEWVCTEELRGLLGRCSVIPQRGQTFGERLRNAHQEVASIGSGRVLQIGMDTPQITAELLADSVRLVGESAVLGPAADGGWWALGLQHGRGAHVLETVPMSTVTTGFETEWALRLAGVQVGKLPELRDVDLPGDIARVARRCQPGSRFRAVARQVEPEVQAGL